MRWIGGFAPYEDLLVGLGRPASSVDVGADADRGAPGATSGDMVVGGEPSGGRA